MSGHGPRGSRRAEPTECGSDGWDSPHVGAYFGGRTYTHRSPEPFLPAPAYFEDEYSGRRKNISANMAKIVTAQ